MARLRDGRVRVLRELIIRSAADWVADDDELVVRHASNAAHEFGRAYKPLRHHRDGRYALPLRCYRIMQTARRAAASVADTGNDGIPFRDFSDDVGVGRRAVVRLRPPYDVSDFELFAQHAFELREIALGAFFAVRDETDGLALERRRP